METNVNESNFAAFLSSAPVALVDFWAPWCGPCRSLSPVISEIAGEYEGKLAVAKCNVDECADISAQYGIRSIPTLILFKGGEPVERIVGALPKSEIIAKIDAVL